MLPLLPCVLRGPALYWRGKGEKMMAQNGYTTVYKSKAWETRMMQLYDAALQRWPVPFEEMEIPTSTAQTHVVRCGNPAGKPLLLLHGTGSNALMWRDTVEGLGQTHCLYLIDTPNDPGKSASSALLKPPEGYAQWMRELLDALGLDRVSAAGHSKGSWLALNMAVNLPERIDKLVLLAPAAGLYGKLTPEYIKKSLKVGLFPTVKNVTGFLAYMAADGGAVSPACAEYRALLIECAKGGMVGHRDFTDAELRTVGCPVLLLYGEQERSLDYRKAAERAKANVRNLQTVIVKGAGHELQSEKPEEINRLICDFV